LGARAVGAITTRKVASMTAWVCEICGRPVDALNPSRVATRVQGWEIRTPTRLSGKPGGSDIVGRERLDVYAHAVCARNEQKGLVRQESLL
jgi:hypothetical protein